MEKSVEEEMDTEFTYRFMGLGPRPTKSRPKVRCIR